MDEWSEWLLHRRHADDDAYGKVVHETVVAFADRVLDGAALAPGMTLADVGTGDGLVGLRAIERIGPRLQLIMTDISATLLGHAAARAAALGVQAQCTFHECPADRLGAIADASVDVVVTRAVLAYVADKSTALREFFRILKPGGRISLAEPILQDEAFYARALRARLDAPQAAATTASCGCCIAGSRRNSRTPPRPVRAARSSTTRNVISSILPRARALTSCTCSS